MKITAHCLLLLSFLFFSSFHLTAQKDAKYGKSMALILKVEGKDKIINEVSVFQKNVFEGKAKNLYTQASVHSESVFHVQVLNDKAEIILDAFLDNPLDLLLESFNPDGSIEKFAMVKDEGHVNLRFPLPAASGVLTLRCYRQSRTGEEVLVSTLQLSGYEN